MRIPAEVIIPNANRLSYAALVRRRGAHHTRINLVRENDGSVAGDAFLVPTTDVRENEPMAYALTDGTMTIREFSFEPRQWIDIAETRGSFVQLEISGNKLAHGNDFAGVRAMEAATRLVHEHGARQRTQPIS